MNDATLQEFPNAEDAGKDKKVSGILILLIFLIFLVTAGIFVYLHFSNNNTNNDKDIFSGKTSVDCETQDVSFNLIGCNYSKTSFYNVQVKFVRNDTNGPSLQDVIVYVISEDNKLSYNKISSGNWLDEQSVNFSKISNKPSKFYIRARLNDSFSCITPKIQCIPVSNNNLLISADAGDDQIVNQSDLVTLDGSASSGANLTYFWAQLSGIDVNISNSSFMKPTFIAPQVSFNSDLIFQLIVSDGKSYASDNITINVLVAGSLDYGTIPPPPPLPS